MHAPFHFDFECAKEMPVGFVLLGMNPAHEYTTTDISNFGSDTAHLGARDPETVTACLGAEVADYLVPIDLSSAKGREAYAAWLEARCDQLCTGFIQRLPAPAPGADGGSAEALTAGRWPSEGSLFVCAQAAISGKNRAGFSSCFAWQDFFTP